MNPAGSVYQGSSLGGRTSSDTAAYDGLINLVRLFGNVGNAGSADATASSKLQANEDLRPMLRVLQ